MKREFQVLQSEHLPEGGKAAVYPGGLPVLLARCGGRVYSVENRCAHMGCPLAAGELRDGVITCPCHDWRFDLRSGAFLDAPEILLRTYETEERGGAIFVKAET
jgi:nitrite reductase/ring-hydroxylating ferredoxin subunit